MKRSRFTDSQIMAVLKQAEAGTPVQDLCRDHGVSTATFYKRRAKFGGMDMISVALLIKRRNFPRPTLRQSNRTDHSY